MIRRLLLVLGLACLSCVSVFAQQPVGSIYNTTPPAPTNGQTLGNQSDQAGNLLTSPGVQFKAGTAWTSATSSGTFQYPTGTPTQGQANSVPAILVQLDQTSTISAGAVTFQGTNDGINWVSMPGNAVLNPSSLSQIAQPISFFASLNVPVLLLTQGYVGVRADLTTAISGTGSVTLYWASLAYSPATTGTFDLLGHIGAILDTTGGGTAPGNQVNVGGVYNSSPKTPSSGQAEPLQLDASSNLDVNLQTALPAGANNIGTVTQGAPAATTAGWPVIAGNLAEATASWTSATGVNTALTETVTGYNTVFVFLNQGTTLTGGVVSFQVSDTTAFTNPYAVQCTQLNNSLPAATTYTFVASTNQAFQCDVASANSFRVLLSTAITGSGTVAVGITASSQADASEEVVGGTVTAEITGHAGATVDAAAGATAATNSVQAGGDYNTSAPAPTNGQQEPLQLDQASNQLTFPGVQFKAGTAWSSGTSSGTFQYPTGTTTSGQLTGAAGFIVQLDQTTTLTGGAVTFQGTFDNTNWVTIPTAQVLNPATYAQLTNPYSFVASTNQPFLIVVSGYVNIRADLSTAITGTGTVTPQWTLLPTVNVVAPVALSSTILAGQQAVTASAAALGTNSLTNGLCVEALSTNIISIYVGPFGVTTSTGIELPARASYCAAVSNSNALYVIASATGASVTWSGN